MSKFLGNLSYGGARPSLSVQACPNRPLTPDELVEAIADNQRKLEAAKARTVDQVLVQYPTWSVRYATEFIAREIAWYEKQVAYWQASRGW